MRSTIICGVCPLLLLVLSLGMRAAWCDCVAVRSNIKGGAVELHKEATAPLAQITRRISLKLAIAQDVSDGKLTLTAAAEQFLAINATDPEFLRQMRWTFPAETDHESARLQVISFLNNNSLQTTDVN